jgi:hypothetical protein
LQHVAELGLPGASWLALMIWALARQGFRQPLLIAGAAAGGLPFLLLHYPTHLALGLIPVALIIGELAADTGTGELRLRNTAARRAGAAVISAAACLVAWGQFRRVGIDVRQATLNRNLANAQAARDQQQRRIVADAIVDDALVLLERSPGDAPWLWRIAGKAQIIGGDGASAEASFRKAYALWPHPEAEFGIGLSLASQGRRSEALIHLVRVCRLNPVLTTMIPDEKLERSVNQMLAASR